MAHEITLPTKPPQVVKPDFAVAYARLAPLVAEAFAHLEANELDRCHSCLRRAREIIEHESAVKYVVSGGAVRHEEVLGAMERARKYTKVDKINILLDAGMPKK